MDITDLVSVLPGVGPKRAENLKKYIYIYIVTIRTGDCYN